MKSAAWTCCALVLVAAPARADVFDLAMTEQSAAIADAVRDLRADSVAVLPFESEIDDRPAAAARPGNALLAKRLAHLLVLSDTKILEPPTPTPSWRDPAGRAALFAAPLPLIYNRAKLAAPAALVSGRVAINPDLSATVEFVAFTRDKPAELRVIYQMGVQLDRGAMADFGVSFSVARPRANFTPIDDPAADDAATILAANDPPDGPDEGPVRVQMLLDGVAAETVPDADSPGNVAARTRRTDGSPAEGQVVTFRLTNTSPLETFGVLLAVNGTNTAAFDGDTLDSGKPPAKQRLWMLAHGQECEIRGYYTSTAPVVYRAFTVMSDAESAAELAKSSGGRVGRYQVRVFGKPRPGPPPVARETDDDPWRDEDRTNLTLADGGRGLGDAGSLAEAKARLAKATKTVATARGIAPDPAARPSATPVERNVIKPGERVQGTGAIEIIAADDFDPHPLVSYDIVYHPGKD